MSINSLDLDSLKKFTTRGTVLVFPIEGHIDIPFEITPRMFLEFAKGDYRGKYSHHMVNALSNTKRALDCQLDSLLFAFGLLDRSHKERWSFPRKAEKISDLGILAPDILKRINKRRNLLEHEYQTPESAEVRDALDIASMFIEYTKEFLTRPWLGCGLLRPKIRNSVQIHLNCKKSELAVELMKLSPDRMRDSYVALRSSIKADSDEYMDYLKWFLWLKSTKEAHSRMK